MSHLFRMFSCLQINWKPFYLRQLFHLIGTSKFVFKARARVFNTKWYRSNQCLFFPLCYFRYTFENLWMGIHSSSQFEIYRRSPQSRYTYQFSKPSRRSFIRGRRKETFYWLSMWLIKITSTEREWW